MDRQNVDGRAELTHEIANPLEALVNLSYLIKFDLADPQLVLGYLDMMDGQLALLTKSFNANSPDPSIPKALTRPLSPD
jgi:hypothetical protein